MRFIFTLFVIIITLDWLGMVLSMYPVPLSGYDINSAAASRNSAQAATLNDARFKRPYEMSEQGKQNRLAQLKMQRERREAMGIKRPYHLSPQGREARREGHKKSVETRKKARREANAAAIASAQPPPKRTYKVSEQGRKAKQENMVRVQEMRLEKKEAAKTQPAHSSSKACDPSTQHDCPSPGLNLSEHEIGEILGSL